MIEYEIISDDRLGYAEAAIRNRIDAAITYAMKRANKMMDDAKSDRNTRIATIAKLAKYEHGGPLRIDIGKAGWIEISTNVPVV
jgi:hypothetical protein